MALAFLDEMSIDRKEDAFWQGLVAGISYATYRPESAQAYLSSVEEARTSMLQQERAMMAEVFNQADAEAASTFLEAQQSHNFKDTWTDQNDFWILANKLYEVMEVTNGDDRSTEDMSN